MAPGMRCRTGSIPAAFPAKRAKTPSYLNLSLHHDQRNDHDQRCHRMYPLMGQATGQDEYEVFPESDTRFFYRVVDAQITFELAPHGTASALALHQSGNVRRGVRSP
jgi:hypothetical protein